MAVAIEHQCLSLDQAEHHGTRAHQLAHCRHGTPVTVTLTQMHTHPCHVCLHISLKPFAVEVTKLYAEANEAGALTWMHPNENIMARAALHMSAPSAMFRTIEKPLSTLPLQMTVT